MASPSARRPRSIPPAPRTGLSRLSLGLPHLDRVQEDVKAAVAGSDRSRRQCISADVSWVGSPRCSPHLGTCVRR
jgi:hypothetical protein